MDQNNSFNNNSVTSDSIDNQKRRKASYDFNNFTESFTEKGPEIDEMMQMIEEIDKSEEDDDEEDENDEKPSNMKKIVSKFEEAFGSKIGELDDDDEDDDDDDDELGSPNTRTMSNNEGLMDTDQDIQSESEKVRRREAKTIEKEALEKRRKMISNMSNMRKVFSSKKDSLLKAHERKKSTIQNRAKILKEDIDKMETIPEPTEEEVEMRIKDDLEKQYHSQFEHLKRQMATMTKQLQQQQKVIAEKDAALTEKDLKLEEKDAALEEKDAVIEETAQELEETKAELEQKDEELEQKDQVIEEKDQELEQKDAELEQIRANEDFSPLGPNSNDPNNLVTKEEFDRGLSDGLNDIKKTLMTEIASDLAKQFNLTRKEQRGRMMADIDDNKKNVQKILDTTNIPMVQHQRSSITSASSYVTSPAQYNQNYRPNDSDTNNSRPVSRQQIGKNKPGGPVNKSYGRRTSQIVPYMREARKEYRALKKDLNEIQKIKQQQRQLNRTERDLKKQEDLMKKNDQAIKSYKRAGFDDIQVQYEANQTDASILVNAQGQDLSMGKIMQINMLSNENNSTEKAKFKVTQVRTNNNSKNSSDRTMMRNQEIINNIPANISIETPKVVTLVPQSPSSNLEYNQPPSMTASHISHNSMSQVSQNMLPASVNSVGSLNPSHSHSLPHTPPVHSNMNSHPHTPHTPSNLANVGQNSQTVMPSTNCSMPNQMVDASGDAMRLNMSNNPNSHNHPVNIKDQMTNLDSNLHPNNSANNYYNLNHNSTHPSYQSAVHNGSNHVSQSQNPNLNHQDTLNNNPPQILNTWDQQTPVNLRTPPLLGRL